jgi:hypothetical protein
MSATRILICALLLLTAVSARAHRLDEYLQATTIAVEKSRVQAEIRLVPGVEVFRTVFVDIDRNADGVASEAEQRAYAQQVLGDLSLRVDGTRLNLRLISWIFAPTKLLQEGRGEIQLKFEADVPDAGATRRLTFENRHHRSVGVYLVNGLVPRDADIRLGAPRRSDDQSFYQLDYVDRTAPAATRSFTAWSGPWGWADAALTSLVLALALMQLTSRRSHAKSKE